MWLIYFLAAWVLYIGCSIFLAQIIGRDIDLLEKVITGLIFAFLIPLGTVVLPGFTTLSRSKYIENNDSTKPSYKTACSSIIDVPQGFDFDNFKNEIASNWVITFSDDIIYVLKFRPKINYLGNWGVGTWLKFDEEAGKIQIECFPMAAVLDNKLARKMLKEIEACLNKITLNFGSVEE